MKKRIFVIGHQGLGDHILCLGLYKHQQLSAKRVYIFVKSNYVGTVTRLLADAQSIKIVPIPRRRFWIYLKILRGICRIFRQEVLLLGTFGRNFLDAELRFDQNFYVQANVPFSTRWNSLTVSATPCPALRHALGINNEKYIFVHEDRTRGYTINPNRLPKGVKIVKPLMPSKKWDFCDYIEVIQGATEIHVIESSFAALVETLGIDGIPKFAHRYARPNAFYDARYEFTYKSDWKILL